MTDMPPIFALDQPPSISISTCPSCGAAHLRSVGIVTRDGVEYCGYIVISEPEHGFVHLEVAFGSFEDPDYADHETISGQFGFRDGADRASVWVIEPTPQTTSLIAGRYVGAEEASSHARLPDFWDVTDWMGLNDPVYFHAAIAIMDAGPSGAPAAHEGPKKRGRGLGRQARS